MVAVCACGDSDDGGGGGDDGGGDGADDGGPDGGVGVEEPAEGQFVVLEGVYGEGMYSYGDAHGTIVDPRPVYHRLEMEAGACRMWSFEIGDCGSCDGVCNADDECIPTPVQLSAGEVTLAGLARDLTLPFEVYGYYPAAALPEDLFDDGDSIILEASGGDVPAFSLTAAAPPPIAIDLLPGSEADDTVLLEDGADMVVTWSPAVAGTRVRLDILSDNRGHGLPVDTMIQCEADDDGEMVVPRAMIEAFPDKPYANVCAGSDCPPSTLTRFRADRAPIGEREVELLVGSRVQFIVVHEPG